METLTLLDTRRGFKIFINIIALVIIKKKLSKSFFLDENDFFGIFQVSKFTTLRCCTRITTRVNLSFFL